VRDSTSGPFVYPDLTVYCGEPQLADDYRDVLLNPRVVFEVLSHSSEAYDRGLKFEAYRRIESLQEYVLVSQSKPYIEVFLRQPQGQWLLTCFDGMDSIAVLASIDSSIALSEVYEGVKLAD